MLPRKEFVDWLFECAEWEIRDLGMSRSIDEGATIVLPTEDDFPVDLSLGGHALVEDYFAFVKEHANLADWDFELVPSEPNSPAAALAGMVHHMTEEPKSLDDDESDPIGDDEPLPIPYDPSLLRTPDLLVAHLALGVAHYYAQSAPTPPPGDEVEHAVDVTGVFLGFGVFTANAALRVESFESGMLVGHGWRRLGSLDPNEIAYALALRAELIGADVEEIREHLRPNPRAWLADFTEHLRKTHARRIDALRAIAPSDGGPYRT